MPFVLKLIAFYAAINAAILLVLAVNVSLVRRRTRTLLLDGGHPELTRAIRAHGNATEYIPIGLILILVAHLLGGTVIAVHAIGLPLTLGRLIHPFGIIQGSIPARSIGTMLTWLALAAGIIIVVMRALAAPG